MNIGAKIKDFRKKSGLTQQQLAELIGKKEVTIRKYENSSREPRLSVIQDICSALNIPIEEFGEELFQIKKSQSSEEDKPSADSLELLNHCDFDSNPLNKELTEINLVKQLLLIQGYKIEFYNLSEKHIDDAEKLESALKYTLPLGKVINLKTQDEFELTNSDFQILLSNLRNFIDFEFFKLKANK